MSKIIVKDKEITIVQINEDDYISLTDIAKIKNDENTNMVIASWIRRVDTIEFLKLWELINNENFKPTDFEGFKSKPGQNAFTISPKKWIELTNAIGLKVKSGRYNGGTYAHKDIAIEFNNSKLIEKNIPPQTRLIILNNEANKEKELFNKNNEKVLKITNNE